jgi:hypothetical protein
MCSPAVGGEPDVRDRNQKAPWSSDPACTTTQAILVRRAIHKEGRRCGAAGAAEDLGPDNEIGDPGLVLDRDKHNHIGAAGSDKDGRERHGLKKLPLAEAIHGSSRVHF